MWLRSPEEKISLERLSLQLPRAAPSAWTLPDHLPKGSTLSQRYVSLISSLCEGYLLFSIWLLQELSEAS